MKLLDVTKNIAITWHTFFARIPGIASLYLSVWSVLLRKLPDSQFKSKIVNSLRSANWGKLTLPPKMIDVGESVSAKIIPHYLEFDFDALFYKRLKYEQEVFAAIEARAVRYDVVIEIGANVGVYTVFLGKLYEQLCPETQIYAFEPSVEAFYRLQTNVRLNSLKNIHLFNCGIGNCTGVTEFYEPKGHLTNGSLYREFAHGFSAEILARPVLLVSGELLGQLLQDRKSPLIKIDVEGAESIVLESMRSLIIERKPDIILEVLPNTQEQLNALDFLFEIYELCNLTPQSSITQARFQATEHRDYLLHPKKT